MKILPVKDVSTAELVDELSRAEAYPHAVDGEIQTHETHISVVFLAGDFVYKVKKPLTTDFLDYSSIQLRQYYCHEEIRLGRRYDKDLYVGVVPILLEDDRLRIGDEETDAAANVVDYAVKMRRFPDEALLSRRIKRGVLTSQEVHDLAEWIATFHQSAAICDPEFADGWPNFLGTNSRQLFDQLDDLLIDDESRATLAVLRSWSAEFLSDHRNEIADRIPNGFIRECHGDLHLQNVVHWGDRLIPFDGIEFNERLRWIDVLSDAAFLSMDLAAKGHLDLSRSFINAYVERTGDYDSLCLLRWFHFYRALIRAMVPAMRASQFDMSDEESREAHEMTRTQLDLAYRFTLRETPSLWITYGVSGSGKTTLSETVVQRHDCFRVVSDVERKRLKGLASTDRVHGDEIGRLYSASHTDATYRRIGVLAARVLRAGYSVIVDATFLRRRHRERFETIAKTEGVAYRILECECDPQTLHQRIANRIARDDDASDADLNVLDRQIAHRDPLSKAERSHVIHIPNLVDTVEQI
ncbi:bifunctional aminoglycoside phosphotransferase/ATP-binding protein [Rhodopirellula sallentina]|uniref:Aminoglycoside phosphotransferase n=1 Tax=Rhodopirellula sallentina SM41 TaxID=1263870 RepID=M5U3M6_9BACT|nr:bifunctional aminoglycoside phosphotransferase/ATP-binding protein [Rhodopirellula sallentina]EMI56057.1 hypothetical protein RSSM_02504 [Rhodopirellula sallentina SM41]